MKFYNLQQISNGVQQSMPKHINGFDSRRSSVISRIINSGENQYQITCLMCGEKSPTTTEFIEHYRANHMKTNDGDVFYCQSCIKTFVSPQNFVAHLRDAHNGFRLHACDLCDEYFISKADLDRHLVTHNIEWPCASNSLENSVKSTFHLTTSIQQEKNQKDIQQGVHSYACYLCQKKFLRKTTLKLHMNIHTGTKSYTCYLCDKIYRHPAQLKVHERSCRLDLSLLSHT